MNSKNNNNPSDLKDLLDLYKKYHETLNSIIEAGGDPTDEAVENSWNEFDDALTMYFNPDNKNLDEIKERAGMIGGGSEGSTSDTHSSIGQMAEMFSEYL